MRSRTSASTGRKAQRVAVHAEPLIEGRPDYSDAFAITLDADDPRTAEDFARDALEGAPGLIYWTIYVAHRFVLRFDLAPRRSPAHVLGWSITHRDRDAIRLEADGPVVRAVIVGRRPERDRSVVTTSMFFRQRAVARVLMPLVGPVHRAVAGHLLEYAVELGARRRRLTSFTPT